MTTAVATGVCGHCKWGRCGRCAHRPDGPTPGGITSSIDGTTWRCSCDAAGHAGAPPTTLTDVTPTTEEP